MKQKIKNKSAEEQTTIQMPEVKDIPGQEHIKPPRMREMMDTTISSADEEGEGILDDLNEDTDALYDNSANVTPIEKDMLKRSNNQINAETEDLDKLALDEIDEDDNKDTEQGDPFDMGEDLDVPGSELDDDDEEIGEEDEENNSYSRPD